MHSMAQRLDVSQSKDEGSRENWDCSYTCGRLLAMHSLAGQVGVMWMALEVYIVISSDGGILTYKATRIRTGMSIYKKPMIFMLDMINWLAWTGPVHREI